MISLSFLFLLSAVVSGRTCSSLSLQESGLWQEIGRVTARSYSESRENLYVQLLSQGSQLALSSDILDAKDRRRARLFAGLSLAFYFGQHFFQRRSYQKEKRKNKKLKEELHQKDTAERKAELIEALKNKLRKERKGLRLTLITDFLGLGANAYTIVQTESQIRKGDLKGSRLRWRGVLLGSWSVYKTASHVQLLSRERALLNCFP